ncbi:ABC transporter permease [Promicromonospora iranensis]|uniref:ABC transporter permease n=1 Tax=Promicromonospora iranensis TaxID=1105144 RepID=UPI0023A9522B|nr:ABC transporter permease [Promicromonospora iranensis]
MARLTVRDTLTTAALGPRSRVSRSLLSMLGVAIGIATLVAILGITATNEARLRADLEALGSNVLVVAPGQGPNLEPVPLPETAPEMIRRIGPVTGAAAVRELEGAGVFRNDLVPSTMGGGLTAVAVQPELAAAMDLHLHRGAWFDAASVTLPTTVLGASAADHLGVSVPGQRVWIDDSWYAVIGVLQPSGLMPDLDRAALLGEDWVLTGHPDLAISRIQVRVQTGTVEAVRDVLDDTANPGMPRAVGVSTPSQLADAQRAVDSTFQSLALGLAAVALLVGAIGIVNTMVIAVLERRGEIALRRAVGARALQIRTQFMLEAGFLGLGGGVAGAVLGLLVVVVYGTWQKTIPAPNFLAAGVGVGLSVLVGVIAGVYPAVRAAQLSPVEGLRSE